MSDFFSPHWHRVAALKPRLNPGLQVARHRYRGESWYVLMDRVTGRSHRVTPSTYLLLGQMDGGRSVDALWQAALARLGDAAPTQDELLRLLGQMHAADMVQCDVTPDAAEIFERHERSERSRRLASVRNPLAIRIPLWDPDRFLDATVALLRPLHGLPALLIWLALVLPALALAAVHWEPLTAGLSDRVLSAGNLLLVWLTFPVVKFVHEMGHAYATKLRGGEVHEIGLMLLVFTPVPYIDSSRANVFRSKWQRAAVASAGMFVETALAAVALMLWVLVEPGLLRALCFNVLLIAGVSTLVFNLNPLLKFDGYYILCDLIEMPNLAQRSQRHLGAWVQRRLFGLQGQVPARVGPGERPWLVAYAPLAFIYRLMVMVTIALFIAGHYFFIGVVLGLLAFVQGLVWPLLKGLGHVLGGETLRPQRARAVGVVALGGATLAALLLAVPAPDRVMSSGVVWLPEAAQLRMQTTGFVQALHAQPGQDLPAGAPVLDTLDPALEAQLAGQQARVEELQARHAAQWFRERSKAEATRQELEAEEATLARLHTEAAQHRLRAGMAGRLILPRAGDLAGRHLRKGDLVGYLGGPEQRTVRAVVPQEAIEAVRGRLQATEVRLASAPEQRLPATVVREVPAGQDQLPSRALALDFGGSFALDPRDSQGLRTLNRVFQVDLDLPADLPPPPVGTRVFVRFELTPTPLGLQAWRALRQLFLARFEL